MSNKNQSPILKTIEVGKFYFIHDGSKSGHPGYIVWKDEERNLYIAIKFGTTKNDDNEILNERISQITPNYIYKRLYAGKRKDFGKDALFTFHISNEIVKRFKDIKKRNLKFSKNVSKAQKHYLNKNKDHVLLDIKK